MTTTKYTPGPWTTGNARDCATGHAVCAGAHIVARVNELGYPGARGWAAESQANARLIAAAPQPARGAGGHSQM